MSTARERILRDLHIALKRGPLAAEQRTALDAERPAHIRPAFDEDLIARFVRKFESRSGTVARVATLAEVPEAVEQYRTAKGLPPRAAIGAALAGLAWPQEWAIHHGAAAIDETLALSRAETGVAETGSLMLCSGPESPTTHNFVPDDHVVVLEAAKVVRHFEDAWVVLRQRPGSIPRATNFVSGPSRTADVEQTIQLGAHGPRRVHVILVGG